MKILIIIDAWGYAGGREQYLFDAIQELTIRGHTFCVVYSYITEKPFMTGIAASLIKYKIPVLGNFETSFDKDYAATLKQILKKEKPDVIFAHDVKNLLLLRQLVDYGKLVTMTHYPWLFCMRDVRALYFSKTICHHTLGIECFLRGCFIRKSSKTIFRYNNLWKLRRVVSVYSEINTNLVASRYMKDLYLQHGFREEQVTTIGYPCIKYPKKLPDYFDDALTKQDSNMLFLGRIDRYKGVDFLLRALWKVQSRFTCTIIGDGPHLRYCKKLAKKLRLGDAVRFLGWLPIEDTKRYVQKAALLVVPSIWPEPFGIIGIEAMSYGKPVVAFDSGGISDWLQNGKTGYLVRTKDITGLANKIDYLLRNPQHACQLGANGRKILETKFDKKRHFDRLINIFEETANNCK